MDNFVSVPVSHEGDFLWCVFERSTEQVIKSFYFEDEATEYIDFLSEGGAFDGWTPAFILTEATKPKEDVNTSFSQRL